MSLSVAHRLSSIVHCDVIIVMDKGRVVEQGSHQHLMRTEGVYAKMWDAQNGEALNSGIDDPSSGEPVKTRTGGFIKDTPVPLSGQSLLWTATSESLASLVISGGGKGLTRGAMEPLMMMKSSAREDRLGFISDLEATHTHGNRAKSVLDVSGKETVSQPDEIIALGDPGPNPESVKNDDKSLI
jgi:ABC-type glutathione transport system ATPase component